MILVVSRPDTPDTGEISSYWYRGEHVDASAVDVLRLLRRYGEADAAMKARVRDEMRMGEKDILALRFLLEARASLAVIRQKDLAAALSITTASASTLVDRLVRDGYARRKPHPDDRRSTAVEATEAGDREVREALRRMHDRMYDVAASLSSEDRAVVARFLQRMVDSLSGDSGTGEG